MERAFFVGLKRVGVGILDRVRHRAVYHREAGARGGEGAAHDGEAVERGRTETLAFGVGLKNHLETLAHNDLLLGGNGQSGVVLRPQGDGRDTYDE